MLSARPSAWAFDTSRSLTVSIGTWASISKEGGTIWLNKQESPDKTDNAIPYSFNYDVIGVGVGVGTMPVSFGPKSAPNVGQMYMLNNFVGKELTADDITGICRFQEVSAGAGIGGTVTAAFLGIELEKLAKAVAARGAVLTGVLGELLERALGDDDVDWTDLIGTGAKAMLLIAGPGVAVGKGLGISDSVGYLQQPWEEMYIPKVPEKPDQKPGPEDTRMKARYNGQVEAPPIVLPDSVFDTGFDTLKPAAESQLREAKNKIAPYSANYIIVDGYTDNVGHGTYNNQALSERRAKRVKDWLIKNAGRKDSDVIARGNGENEPVAPNTTVEGRAKNRRVEIRIMQAGWKPR